MENKYWEQVSDQAMEPQMFNENEVTEADIEWYSRAIKSLDMRAKQVEQDAQAQIDDINAWKESELTRINNNRNRFEESLINTYRVRKEQDPNYRLSNPYIRISERKSNKWEYQNEQEIISSLKDNGEEEFIKNTESIDKAFLKKHSTVSDGKVVTENGTLVEGIKVDENQRNITLKVEGN